MYWLNSTFTDTDAILSRRDALLRTLGAMLWALVAAWVVIVALWIAGVHVPAWLGLLAAAAAGALAWRHLDARVLPDGVTRLAGRRLFGLVLSIAFGGVGAWAMYELVLHGAWMELTPFAALMAAPIGGATVYAWCRWVARVGLFGKGRSDRTSPAGAVVGLVVDLADD